MIGPDDLMDGAPLDGPARDAAGNATPIRMDRATARPVRGSRRQRLLAYPHARRQINRAIRQIDPATPVDAWEEFDAMLDRMEANNLDRGSA